jgi:hypothetical protein
MKHLWVVVFAVALTSNVMAQDASHSPTAGQASPSAGQAAPAGVSPEEVSARLGQYINACMLQQGAVDSASSLKSADR